jgi:hypothetical protein
MLPPREMLNNWLHYDPDTGMLYWRPRPLTDFPAFFMYAGWQSRFQGKVAGYQKVGKNGRRLSVRLTINGYGTIEAHRLIWLMVYGNVPSRGLVIDHKNGDPWDNSLANLRVATYRQNSFNSRTHRDNVHGLKGVTRGYKGHYYAASILLPEGRHFIGHYKTPEEAHQAYCEYTKAHHGEFHFKNGVENEN